MKIKDTIFLLIAAILLGGYICYTEQPFSDSRTADGDRVIPASLFPLEHIAIQDRKDEKVLALKDGTWYLEKPVQARANGDFMKTFTASLKVLKRFRVIPAGKTGDPAKYGLRDPELRFTAEGKNGAVTVMIGGPTPGPGHVYARTADSRNIFVMSADFCDFLRRDIAQLRNTNLFDYDLLAVRSLTVQWGNSGAELAKEGEQWFTLRPAKFPCDNKAVYSLLKEISGLQAGEFLESPPEEKTEPMIVVGLGGEKKQQLSAVTAIKTGKTPVYSEALGSPALVPAEKLREVVRSSEDLMRRQIAGFAPQKIDRFRIQNSREKEIVVERTEKGWAVRGLEKTDPLVVRYLIANITYGKITDFIPYGVKDLSVFGLDPARAVLEISADGRTEKLLVGNLCKKGVFAKFSAYDRVFTLPDIIQDVLLRPRIFYKRRSLLDLDHSKISRFRRVLDGKNEIFRRISGNNWQQIAPRTAPAENLRIQVALVDISGLKAGEFIRPPDADTDYGFSNPEVRFEFTCGDKDYILEISPEKKGNLHYARLNTEEDIFTVSETVYKDLKRKFTKEQ